MPDTDAGVTAADGSPLGPTIAAGSSMMSGDWVLAVVVTAGVREESEGGEVVDSMSCKSSSDEHVMHTSPSGTDSKLASTCHCANKICGNVTVLSGLHAHSVLTNLNRAEPTEVLRDYNRKLT